MFHMYLDLPHCIHGPQEICLTLRVGSGYTCLHAFLCVMVLALRNYLLWDGVWMDWYGSRTVFFWARPGHGA
jgi:hypothetical protein